jgi:hypothetical protein
MQKRSTSIWQESCVSPAAHTSSREVGNHPTYKGPSVTKEIMRSPAPHWQISLTKTKVAHFSTVLVVCTHFTTLRRKLHVRNVYCCIDHEEITLLSRDAKFLRCEHTRVHRWTKPCETAYLQTISLVRIRIILPLKPVIFSLHSDS